jgi:hypothetical protein
MGKAKLIQIAPVKAKIAFDFVLKNHYSGKVVNNSVLHFGVFYNNLLAGVLQFGPPLDKSKVIGLVKNQNGDPAPWNDFFELNRMVFLDLLPRNSESRAIAICVNLIKKKYPNIKWIISFADATQCGHGTIYQAAGFKLTQIKESNNIARINGVIIHKMALANNPTKPIPFLPGKPSFYDITGGKYAFSEFVKKTGGEMLVGYQIRYILILDKQYRLACPDLPYSEIHRVGARMYKGESLDLPEHAGEA